MMQRQNKKISENLTVDLGNNPDQDGVLFTHRYLASPFYISDSAAKKLLALLQDLYGDEVPHKRVLVDHAHHVTNPPFFAQPSIEPAKWEEVTVDPKGAGHTYRLRAPGGWLYRTVTYRYPGLHKSWEETVVKCGGIAGAEQELREGTAWENQVPWTDRDFDRAEEIVTMQQTFVPEASK